MVSVPVEEREDDRTSDQLMWELASRDVMKICEELGCQDKNTQRRAANEKTQFLMKISGQGECGIGMQMSGGYEIDVWGMS